MTASPARRPFDVDHDLVHDVRAPPNIDRCAILAQDCIQLTAVRGNRHLTAPFYRDSALVQVDTVSSLTEKWATTRSDWKSAMIRVIRDCGQQGHDLRRTPRCTRALLLVAASP